LHALDQHQTGEGNADGRLDELLPAMDLIDDPEVLKTFVRHQHSIARDRRYIGRLQEVINVPLLDSITLDGLMEDISRIFQQQKHPFKINFAFGYILDNVQRTNGEEALDVQPRYFQPFRNTHALTYPHLISSVRDIGKLRRKLDNMKLLETLRADRPDTRWTMAFLTNVRYVVYKIPRKHLGCKRTVLPPYLKRRRCVKDFPRADNLCLFRCIAYGAYGARSRRQLAAVTQSCFEKWLDSEYCTASSEAFPGVVLAEIKHYIQSCLNVNISIFQLHQGGRVETVYLSPCTYERSINVNLFQNHLSLITSMESYGAKYECNLCSYWFSTRYNRDRHTRLVCQAGRGGDRTEARKVFRGGFYRQPLTLGERMAEVGIPLPDGYAYSHVSCFDIECALAKLARPEEEDDPSNSSRVAEHVCVSIALCSNVRGHQEAVCFIDNDVKVLVEKMLHHLHLIQSTAEALTREQLREPIRVLQSRIAECEESSEPLKQLRHLRHLTALQRDFELFIRQLPVLTYNGSRYDLIVLRPVLLPLLHLHDDPRSYVLKKNNAYMCISTPTLRFLDTILYVGGSGTYADFLKSQGVEAKKSHFPYEMLQQYSDLDREGLPPYDSFFSALKGVNTLEAEHLRYTQLLANGKQQALDKMKLTTPPPSGSQQYEALRQLWAEKGMRTLGDLLRYYNVQDTQPLIIALENMWKFYRRIDINVFKDCISVPGIARKLLYKMGLEDGASFALVHPKDDWVQLELLDRGKTGGPSIVFSRYAKAGETKINRTSEHLCRSVQGWDCNSM
jgi:hypothetical protein